MTYLRSKVLETSRALFFGMHALAQQDLKLSYNTLFVNLQACKQGILSYLNWSRLLKADLLKLNCHHRISSILSDTNAKPIKHPNHLLFPWEASGLFDIDRCCCTCDMRIVGAELDPERISIHLM